MTRRWPTLRAILTAHVSFAVLVWLAFLAGSLLVATATAIWGRADHGIWHYVATQGPRWLALGLGFDAVNTYLRPHVAGGRTRGDFLRQLCPYVAGIAVVLGLLVTLGYLAERAVYALAGWRYGPPFPSWFRDYLYPLGGATNYAGTLGAFTLMLLMWTLAGVLVAAAFNRGVLLGAVSVPVGLLVVAPMDIQLGWGGIWQLYVMTEDELRPSLLTAAGVSVAGIVLACVAIWGVVRDLPVRPKVA
jgi:hypothetical protein